MTQRNKKPWPTQKVMQQIYELHFWGDNGQEFYSGEGSHLPELVDPYIQAVKQFIQSLNQKPSILDLGCGDFNIGRQIYPFAQQYIAADIVPEIIAHHRLQYPAPHLSFEILNLATDPLPPADILIVRQVLQHLSNREIQDFLPQLKHYKYLILTEHLPSHPFTPNADIISGRNIRLQQNSGVDLQALPFHFKFKTHQLLCETPCAHYGGVLRTDLFEL